MVRDTLSTYPDFNEELKLQTNARNFQLGVVIIRKWKPNDFHSIKITDYQKSYTVTDKELVSIVEIIKEFITILLGKILRIYTNQKNLSCKMFNTDRVIRWILILE